MPVEGPEVKNVANGVGVAELLASPCVFVREESQTNARGIGEAELGQASCPTEDARDGP